jgi:hypothetical protein
MVLTAYFALSPVIGLFCHRRLTDASVRLDASVEASGPHDFAVRKQALSSKAPLRPPHPAPTSVTIAKRPSCGRGIAMDIELIWVFGKSEYFFIRGWTGNSQNSPSGKSTHLFAVPNGIATSLMKKLRTMPRLLLETEGGISISERPDHQSGS